MKKAPNNTMLQNNINRLCENQKMIKLIAIIDLPNDFKGGHADCKIYEDKGKHRIFDRIVYLDKMPKLKEKTDKKASEYIDYLYDDLAELEPLPQSIDIRKIECAKSKLYAPNTKATIDEILGEE